MATDNKQKVLIRSMSYDELMDYLVNSDLNGKIIPKNEDTWHQNYGDIVANWSISSIIQNNSKLSEYLLFLNRKLEILSSGNNFIYHKFKEVVRINDFSIPFHSYGPYYIKFVPVFRPLIEYKE